MARVHVFIGLNLGSAVVSVIIGNPDLLINSMLWSGAGLVFHWFLNDIMP